MSEISIYISILFITVVYLNSHFKITRGKLELKHDSNLMVIEHLTQFSTKPKNYRREPENYQAWGYFIKGAINDQKVNFSYRFPLLNNEEVTFNIDLESNNTSSIVSQYGAHTSCFGPVGTKHFQLATSDDGYLKKNMNSDGFYFKDFANWGLDYNHVIKISEGLCLRIAHFIVASLQARGEDSYLNRVQASLCFVQYIPYGVPVFDENEYTYFGLALPHETIGISYSDCDSKSTLMAGILKNMIATENIVLVLCEVDGGGHMITGVAGLHVGGKTVTYKNKAYTLLETTFPNPIGYERDTNYTNLKIIPLKSK
jgi:hypothetical protein